MFKVTIWDLKNKDRNMADNIEHQDKGELVTNCDRFNSLKHSTVRSLLSRSREWLCSPLFLEVKPQFV